MNISYFYVINKRTRIPKGQSKQDNPEKLATQCTQDEDKQNKEILEKTEGAIKDG